MTIQLFTSFLRNILIFIPLCFIFSQLVVDCSKKKNSHKSRRRSSQSTTNTTTTSVTSAQTHKTRGKKKKKATSGSGSKESKSVERIRAIDEILKHATPDGAAPAPGSDPIAPAPVASPPHVVPTVPKVPAPVPSNAPPKKVYPTDNKKNMSVPTEAQHNSVESTTQLEIRRPKIAKGERKTVDTQASEYKTLACNRIVEKIDSNESIPGSSNSNPQKSIPSRLLIKKPKLKKGERRTVDSQDSNYKTLVVNNLAPAKARVPGKDEKSTDSADLKIAKGPKGKKKTVTQTTVTESTYQPLAVVTAEIAKDPANAAKAKNNKKKVEKPKEEKLDTAYLLITDVLPNATPKDKNKKPAQGNTFEIKRPTIAKGEKKMVSSSDENYQTLAGISDTFAKDKDAKPSPNNAPEIKRPKITRGENKMVSSSDENYQTLAGLTDVFAKAQKLNPEPKRSATTQNYESLSSVNKVGEQDQKMMDDDAMVTQSIMSTIQLLNDKQRN